MRLRATDERGSSTVEFALVLPIVLLVMLAILQLGLILRDQLVVTDAARVAAREAAVSADDGSVRTAAERTGLRSDALTVSIARSGGRGSPVTVDLTYRVEPAIPAVAWLLPGDVVLRAGATARQEFDV